MSLAEDDSARLRAWADAIDDSTYYEILGILELADAAAIQKAFHDFARAFHPDVHQGATAHEREAARAIFQRGAEAYRVLSDEVRRSEYDLAVARGLLRLGSEPEGAPPLAPEGDGPRSLEDICRTPAARLAASNAHRCLGSDDLESARRLLKEALAMDDYDNPALEERIEALDLALFARGR